MNETNPPRQIGRSIIAVVVGMVVLAMPQAGGAGGKLRVMQLTASN